MTNQEIMSEIGKRLARRRRELDLSLAGVAERCGVSLQQVHKYETGQSLVSAPMLFRLSLCLGVPVAWFFEALEARAEA
jgi:transcriptional regulator with XRE-family HTH domain